MAKEFPTDWHRQRYIEGLKNEITSLEQRVEHLDGALDGALGNEVALAEAKDGVKAAQAELDRVLKLKDETEKGDGGEKPLAKMKLAELVEKAAEVGIDGDDLEALKKPGVSKKTVIDAIQAKQAQA